MWQLKRAFAVLLLIPGCSYGPARPNQAQGSRSPSGRYSLAVPIEAQTTIPSYSGTKVWKVTISDAAGTVVYKDQGSTFVGHLNTYWGWDEHDRVWVYNSDDGRIWRWEFQTNAWIKIESTKADGIPEFILPDYEKKVRK